MEETVKLYDTNAYLKSFEAEVISCKQEKDKFIVVLNQTAFYPEGGGQPSDFGWIEDSIVSDVQEKAGIIYHTCNKSFELGHKVTGIIDWKRRFKFMQQHSGEHIFSGITNELFGYDNVGFHIGSACVTVDFNGSLTEEQLFDVEEKSNEVVFANRKIIAEYPSEKERAKINYRSKKEIDGQVRIITIPTADCCACCGTHVQYTGEIGIIKVIGYQNYKGGIRVSLKFGWDAIADYNKKMGEVKAISNLLSAKTENLYQAVVKLTEDKNTLKMQLADLKQELICLKRKEVDITEEKTCYFADDLSPNEIRQLCDSFLDKTKLAFVLSGEDGSGYKYTLGSRSIDVREIGQKLNASLSGRGGGTKEMVQGTLAADRHDIEVFFKAIK